MGGGVSKADFDRVQQELAARDQMIKALQEKLDDSKRTTPTGTAPVGATSFPKQSRISHAVVVSPPTGSSSSNNDNSSSSTGSTSPLARSTGGLRTPIEGDQDEHTTSMKNYAKRRVEVSAEVISKKQLLSSEKVVYPKNDTSKEMIMKVLQSNILFSGLSTAEINDCLDAFFPMKSKAGTLVIKQGDQGDHFYAVEFGQLEILVAVNQSTPPIRYGFLNTGQGFGELALLCNTPRAATIRAVTEVELWALERSVFREILASHKLMRLNKAIQILRQVPILNKLTQSEMQKIAAAMEWEEYEEHKTIIRQGEVGEHFYIITKGEILVTQANEESKHDTEIRVMRAGDHFGEMSLLKDETRSATCTAISHVQCLTLGREHFIAMLGTLQELMDREPPPANPRDNRLSSSDMCLSTTRMASGITTNPANSPSKHGQHDAAFYHDYKYLREIPKGELEVLQTLGRGAFGRVKLVRHAATNSAYALKCLVKSRIVENNLKEHVLNEKKVMLSLDHPFILKLFSTYKDSKYLYFLVELALGGELFTYLRRKDRFDEAMARFYVASVVLVFQHMHSKNIVYRDLKPENILLDTQGFMKMADFGLAKIVTDRTWTLCGTPDYLAPEIILNKGHDKAVDCWALGILIYELIAGQAPFFANDPMQIYGLIIQGNLKFPVYFSRPCIDLVEKLLCQNPARRLGNMKHGFKDVINHKWFAGFPWEGLVNKNIKPPFIPQIRDAFDTSNFDDFCHELEDSVIDCEWDPDF